MLMNVHRQKYWLYDIENKNFLFIMLFIPFITYTMITGTSSLSSGQDLRNGTHPFEDYFSCAVFIENINGYLVYWYNVLLYPCPVNL